MKSSAIKIAFAWALINSTSVYSMDSDMSGETTQSQSVCEQVLGSTSRSQKTNVNWAQRFVSRLQIEKTALQSGIPQVERDRQNEVLGHFVSTENSEVLYVFSIADLSGIKQKGFLNGHQLRKSTWAESEPEHSISGLSLREYLAERRNVENAMANAKPSAQRRPKYALIQFYDPVLIKTVMAAGGTSAGDREGGGIDIYGSVAAVFKKDVRSRATFTLSDSLQLWGEKATLNSLEVRANLFTFLEPKFIFDPKDRHWEGRYFEAQIWGDLSWDDVEYLMVDPYFFDKYPDSKAIHGELELLKGRGIPVYWAKKPDTSLANAFPQLDLGEFKERPVSELGYWVKGERLY